MRYFDVFTTQVIFDGKKLQRDETEFTLRTNMKEYVLYVLREGRGYNYQLLFYLLY